MQHIPEHSLTVERTIQASPDIVWRCWTEPELLKQWFCPKPWQVSHAELDLRPGGAMNTTRQGPDGESMTGLGCYLLVEPQQRLIFTDAFRAGFIPNTGAFLTTVVELNGQDNEHTYMLWQALHASAEDRDKHLQMGFEAGWNAAADQLMTLAQSLHTADGQQ